MGLESVTYISDFDQTNPDGADSFSDGDNHIRNVKKGILNTFPNVDGAISVSQSEINLLAGVDETIQEKLDQFSASISQLAVNLGSLSMSISQIHAFIDNYTTAGATSSLSASLAEELILTHGLGTDDVEVILQAKGSAVPDDWAAMVYLVQDIGYNFFVSGPGGNQYVPADNGIAGPESIGAGKIGIKLINPGATTQAIDWRISVKKRAP